MRKQYHFRPSERGLLAWDVHRLIELSRELPSRPVRVEGIAEIDEVYWFDDDEERPTCRRILDHMRLIEAVDPAYPIILSADGRVMDGMHRVMRALLEGRDTLDAVRFEVDPEPDYVGCRPRDLPYD